MEVKIMRIDYDWALTLNGRDWSVQGSSFQESVLKSNNCWGKSWTFLHLERMKKWVCFNSVEAAWYLLAIKIRTDWAHIKICHENSDKSATALQCCIFQEKKDCHRESKLLSQNCINTFELSRLENEAWTAPAQI